MKHLKLIIGFVSTFLLVAGLVAYVGYPKSANSFTFQGTQYQCSRNVIGRMAISGFKPGDQQEFDKFCRMYNGVPVVPDECTTINAPSYCNIPIEYRSVIDILRREDVATTIEKYHTTQASVKALGHTYIQDKDYLKRILPAYSNVRIDCIIVVHSPEGTRFFIENGEQHSGHDDHQYLEVPADEFLTSLNNAPDSDVSNFWLGLR